MAPLFSSITARKLSEDDRIITFEIKMTGCPPRPLRCIISCKTWCPSMNRDPFQYKEKTKLVLDSTTANPSEATKEERCTICLEEGGGMKEEDRIVTVFPCNHTFHYLCITELAKYTKECSLPGCRSPLPESS
ncbi:hypothetical protein Droror1_Dr00006095 [Drosera rotundifolia]